LKSSKFLTKNDVEPPVTVTIKAYKRQNVALESQLPEEKWVLYFRELEKPLVLNMTNGMAIASIAGSESFDDWIGKKIVLYHDRNISYAGKIVGGIRVCPPKGKNATAVVPDSEENSDGIPF